MTDRYGDSYRPGHGSGAGSGYGSRDNRRDYDPYGRPPPPVYNDRPPPPPPDANMYHFRGAADRARDNHPADSYRPRSPAYDRPSHQSHRGDSYRSGNNNAGFDFNFQSGSGTSFAPTTEYPSARRSTRPQQPARGRDRGRGGRGRGGRGRPYNPPPPPSARALLRTEREPTPEQMEGMNLGQSRFKPLGDMADSDSEDMDLSDGGVSVRPAVTMDDSESEDEHPRAKRARIMSPQPAQDQIKPKWSNPDPYTALPPPDESQTKKKDVVKLIRKAKLEAAKTAITDNAASDFISLNFDDHDNNKAASESGEISSERSSEPPSLNNKSTAAPPSAPQQGINMALPAGRLDVWPPPPPDSHGLDAAVRKQASADTTANARNKNKRKHRSDAPGDIVAEWAPPGDADPTPWLNMNLHGMPTLQQEILDFYDYVRPRDFEEQVRLLLVQRIQRAIAHGFSQWQVQVFPFGSFASGLYLPTADMDLVAVSSSFMTRGTPQIGTHGKMRKFAACLENANIIKPGSLTVIAHARVPIIKFVDKDTGLRVDVSFENNSGLTAQKTFEDWKAQYPAMPPIVSLIKQFLVMRGLSEVFNGGLGGYSIICLVVNSIRRLLKKKGSDWDQMQHLDHILMDFFIYYGEEFDRYTTGIQMEPWGQISKNHYNPRGGKRPKPERLLIIDPNKYENDISGGTSEIGLIFETFSHAATLTGDSLDHAEQVWQDNTVICSILEPVWGGNYGLFEVQRAHLKNLWDQQTKPAGFPRDIPAPPGSSAAFPRGNQAPPGPSATFPRGIQAPPGPSAAFPRGIQAPPGPSAATSRAAAQVPSRRQKMAGNGAGTKQSPIDLDIDTGSKSSDALPSSSFTPINRPEEPKPEPEEPNTGNRAERRKAKREPHPEAMKLWSKGKEARKARKAKKANKADVPGTSNDSSKVKKSNPNKGKFGKPTQERERAKAFQKQYPGADCPERLTKDAFKALKTAQQSK